MTSCQNIDCLLCQCVTSKKNGVALLQDLLKISDSEQMLNQCNYSCFAKAMLDYQYPIYIEIFLGSKFFDKIKALEKIFTTISEMKLFRRENEKWNFVIKHFDKESRQKFILEKVVEADSKIDIDTVKSLQCMNECSFRQPVEFVEPVAAPAVENKIVNTVGKSHEPNIDYSVDYFGVSGLQTSTTSVVKSTDLAHKIEQKQEEKTYTKIITKIPLYLEAIVNNHFPSCLYITLIRLNKILLTGDDISKRAVMIASQKIFQQLDKIISNNEIGVIPTSDIVFLSDIVCQILTDCHYLK